MMLAIKLLIGSFVLLFSIGMLWSGFNVPSILLWTTGISIVSGMILMLPRRLALRSIQCKRFFLSAGAAGIISTICACIYQWLTESDAESLIVLVYFIYASALFVVVWDLYNGARNGTQE